MPILIATPRVAMRIGKFEIRSAKLETNSKSECSKPEAEASGARRQTAAEQNSVLLSNRPLRSPKRCPGDLSPFRISIFGFVSDFDIRISDLGRRKEPSRSNVYRRR